MATPRKIQLDPNHKPVYSVGNLTQASAQKVTELLQKNHDEYHIFFNSSGFHNHIAHHILAIYALGAEPSDIQRGFDENKTYQLPLKKFSESKVQGMLNDSTAFTKDLGVRDAYADYLEFFKREMESKGWQAVLQEFLWSGTPIAEDLFGRLYAGFLHPAIHLGYGIEFDQPAIVAEALAQAAVHDNSLGKFLLGAEREASKYGDPAKTIEEIRQSMIRDPKLVESADGILERAPHEMLAAVAQFVVPSAEAIPFKTAMMMNFAGYYTGAAQRPPYEPKIDFFHMHGFNSAIFFPRLMSVDYIPDHAKIRLLEWKVRTDLGLYGSQGFADLKLDEITNFTPKDHKEDGWPQWIKRVIQFSGDDGHAAKLIRVTAATKHNFEKGEVAEGRGYADGFVLDGHALDKLAAVVLHSIHLPGPRWVRGCGFPEAWSNLPIDEARKKEMAQA